VEGGENVAYQLTCPVKAGAVIHLPPPPNCPGVLPVWCLVGFTPPECLGRSRSSVAGVSFTEVVDAVQAARKKASAINTISLISGRLLSPKSISNGTIVASHARRLTPYLHLYHTKKHMMFSTRGSG
jgi:hypothetical protein